MPIKPDEKEDEYFARMELERRRKVEVEKQARMKEAERQQQKELHFMHCPKCGHTMVEVELQEIKVDKCTCCKGIYFDDGELEQILEKQPGRFLKTVFSW